MLKKGKLPEISADADNEELQKPLTAPSEEPQEQDF